MKKEKLLAAGSLTLIFIIGALVLVAGPGFAGPPQSYDSVVVGESDPSTDVSAVQAAVDYGGTVLLVGTFDFGPDGSVKIENDVEILGETDNQGNPLTKIEGGQWTFYSPLPDSLPPGPKMTIQGIQDILRQLNLLNFVERIRYSAA